MPESPPPNISSSSSDEQFQRAKSHSRLAEIAHIFSGILSGKNSCANSPSSSPAVSRQNSTVSLHRLASKLEDIQRPLTSSQPRNLRGISSEKITTLRASRPDPASASSLVKETHHVHLEYDPVSRRKVLNTYEILKDLGSGQHGKVKLARDIESNRLVAIKIVDRKAKPRLGRLTRPGNSQEDKIRKEIAIMKKCDHPHVVKLIEVLDAENSRKIYLVLEYLEKGEIEWQINDPKSGEKGPFLRFAEAQQVFRDVVSGLEYLHYQGIIHRDIKPSNLLVSKNNVVKISDFGVSFSANLDGQDEYELAKTAGTPAFLAPELCQTEGYDYDVPVTSKIDIWALGVTLYCLLFGSLPFNGESEFALFESINKDSLDVPPKSKLRDPTSVSDPEYEEAKDMLLKLLEKDQNDRIGIDDIKDHPFFASGLSRTESRKYATDMRSQKIDVTTKEVDEAVIGIGNRIKRGIASALKRGNFKASPVTSANSGTPLSDHRLLLGRERSSSSARNAKSILDSPARDHSLILSETPEIDSPTHPLDIVSASPTTTTAGPGSPVLQSMRDLHIRKASLTTSIDSFGSGSAGLHETKQNVGGDIYLGARDSAVAQLAGIMDKDEDKRRKSVDLLNSPKSAEEKTGLRRDIPTAAVPSCEADELLISDHPSFFDSSNRVSLPVTDSFASLNSFYDDKIYPEIVSPISPSGYGAGTGIAGSRNAAYVFRKPSVTSPPLAAIDNTVFKDSYKEDNAIPRGKPTVPSNRQHTPPCPRVKFEPSVRPSVSRSGETVTKKADTSRGGSFFIHSDESSDDESVSSPKEPVRSPFNRKVDFSSFQGGSDSEGSQNSDASEEEEDELTLVFSPKRGDPQRRFMNRAMSHESNLPTLQTFARQPESEEAMRTTSPFAVDTPPELLHKLGLESRLEAHSESAVDATTQKRGSREEPQGISVSREKNAPVPPNATLDAPHQATKVSYVPSHYQNHYNKEHMVIPFQSKALHYHGKGKRIGAESNILHQDVVPSPEKLNLNNIDTHGETRPEMTRNNSITIGILQWDKERG
ncbi:unnamed protein product [Kuraishia capsulata CBS 1993]|uniref:non-specific serine/threonine protein kinase n=1 Tax=Kuraishia capsulata CBS 1993 TaxID=1382522 RepID=W6MRB9_9ASCO|nr:uncharacterized protein KUCA_T00000352001 [Kuraishia capsulata CBS 1993]CDK24390.1 unnamed protein product [Kuraishia capsulata CBS 1993]